MGIVRQMNRNMEEVWLLHKQRSDSIVSCCENSVKDSLWPHGFSDGKNIMWVEGDMLHAWGGIDSTVILQELKRLYRIKILDIF